MKRIPVPNTFFLNFAFTPKLSKSAGLFLCEYPPLPKCKVLGKNLDIFREISIYSRRAVILLCRNFSFLRKFSRDIYVALVALILCITQGSGLLGCSRKSLCQFLTALWKASQVCWWVVAPASSISGAWVPSP